MLAHTDQLKGKQRENIEASHDQILLAKRLATIDLNVPVAFDPQALTMESPDIEMLAALYRELGFRSFLNEIAPNPFQGMKGTHRANIEGAQPVNGTGSSGSKSQQVVQTDSTKRVSLSSGQSSMQGDLFSTVSSVGSSASGTQPAVTDEQAQTVGSGERLSVAASVSPSTAADGPNGHMFKASTISDDAVAMANHNLHAGVGAGEQEGAAEGSDLFAQPALATVQTVPHQYHVVTEPDKLKALAERLSAVDLFCFDTETTGFDVFGDRLVGISFAVEPHEAWYIPCDRTNVESVLETFRPVFENETIAKVGQNIKFDMMMLRSAGVEVRGRLYDTMIIHYLLDPEARIWIIWLEPISSMSRFRSRR